MEGTEAHTTGLALQAKASIHRVMALFTQHWGQMHQLLGEETCEQNDRGNAWRDFYDGVDGMGHESITSKGEFYEGDPEKCLDEIEGLNGDLWLYREKWKGFIPNDEQAAAFDDLMAVLDAVDAELDEAAKFIRACRPEPASKTAEDPGEEGDEADP